MFEKILVPVDTSEMSQHALEAALSLADRFGSEVVLLHIRGKAATLEHGDAETELDDIEVQGRRLLAQGLSRLRNDHTVSAEQVRSEVRAGPVVQIIEETASELMIDVIVMGTHGRHRVSEVLTGSTAEQVVARTSASVLVIKPKGYPFLRD